MRGVVRGVREKPLLSLEGNVGMVSLFMYFSLEEKYQKNFASNKLAPLKRCSNILLAGPAYAGKGQVLVRHIRHMRKLSKNRYFFAVSGLMRRRGEG